MQKKKKEQSQKIVLFSEYLIIRRTENGYTGKQKAKMSYIFNACTCTSHQVNYSLKCYMIRAIELIYNKMYAYFGCIMYLLIAQIQIRSRKTVTCLMCNIIVVLVQHLEV